VACKNIGMGLEKYKKDGSRRRQVILHSVVNIGMKRSLPASNRKVPVQGTAQQKMDVRL
jgi:hypothetical protein